MTLTVRTATVSGATTKGGALTHAEMDANWDHVANFTPSGTGATAEAIRTALQRLPHSSQYSSVANFNTAQAALSGTVGVAALRIGAGNSQITGLQQLVFPNTDPATNSAYAIAVNYSTLNGVVDCNLGFGYNGDGAVAAEPRFYDTMEAHYFDATTHWCEQNKEFYTAAGVNTRLYGMQVNRANGQANWAWVGPLGITYYSDALNGEIMQRWEPTKIGFFGSPVTGTGLAIGGTQNSASDQNVFSNVRTMGALVGGFNVVGMRSATNIAASTAIGTIYEFAASDADSFGAGSTLTNHYGFAASDLVKATNNYGFEGLLTSGANKWNLHMSGTAQNFLQGVTGIGIAASSTAQLALAAGTTGVSSLRIPHGAAPTSPVNGDMWTTTGGLFVRINGATVGPLS